MTRKITVGSVDGTLVATLPEEMAESLGVAAGDTLYAIRTDVGVLLTPHDPAMQESLEAFEVLNAKYSSVLRELAK
jgi:putative addiction module antidote